MGNFDLLIEFNFFEAVDLEIIYFQIIQSFQKECIVIKI